MAPDGLSDPLAMDTLSYIVPVGYCSSPNCGYCHNQPQPGRPRKRFNYYASARSLSPGLYQKLVDRCWRRSGSLLYRPNQRHSCCPHYTIRLDADAAAFRPTRDQRQAVNRFNRFVVGDAYAAAAARAVPRSRDEARRRDTTFDLVERIREAESERLPPLPAAVGKEASAAAAADAAADADASPRVVGPAHRFEVTLEPDTFSEEKYLVFENYQRVVHREPASKISRPGFTSFLCNSPLRRETLTEADPGAPSGKRSRPLGSFHQCYRLDGRLVAVGVLDLLPHGVSAVYFLYHESLHRHSPGKLAALREIALAREAGYRWWYSGYYIHSCPKMRYKIDFAPQYVLDPETWAWDRLDADALAVFDRKAYVSLARERQRARDVAMEEAGEAGEAGEADEAGEAGEADEAGGADPDDASSASSDDGAATPLFASDMPGLPPASAIAQFPLDDVRIRTSLLRDPFPVRHLVVWSEGTPLDGTSFKSKVAELVAMVGVDAVDELCLDFRGRAA